LVGTEPDPKSQLGLEQTSTRSALAMRPGRFPRRRKPYLGARPIEGRDPAATGLPSQAPVSRPDPQ